MAAINRLGLTRRSWWKRSELETTIGGFLVGLTFALPDIVGFFWQQDSDTRTGVVSGAMIAMLVIGLFFSVHGWFQGNR